MKQQVAQAEISAHTSQNGLEFMKLKNRWGATVASIYCEKIIICKSTLLKALLQC